tara:strand:+ start:848 stop:1030 length:183 start_codon:yes stop_codon:yes gene_type:complete
MELPIDQNDLKIIVNALALGGDARLYHKLKCIKEEYDLKESNNGEVLNEDCPPYSSQCDI